MTRILILGAGCTGLGAASRLRELGHTNFLILEKNLWAGGLSASFTRDGFTWDIGGHARFSGHPYYEQVMDSALPAGWVTRTRRSDIWIGGRFVPYPLQNHLRWLPKDDALECLLGLIARPKPGAPAANYREWINSVFGSGLATLFFIPYTLKSWAQPPETMSASWASGRVPEIDLSRAIENLRLDRDEPDDPGKGTFQVAAQGGSGAVWRSIASSLPGGSIQFGAEVARIDYGRHRVIATDGSEYPYDALISSLPLDFLGAAGLKHSALHVVGAGIRGAVPAHLEGRHWIYFPESDCPFYRISVLSNYQPGSAPPGYWSLVAETSASECRPVGEAAIVEETIAGLRHTGILDAGSEVAATWHYRADYGYPTPTVDRDRIADPFLRELEERQIYSRGRFGAWKYEAGNQDQCFMQGVEVVDRLLLNEPERTLWGRT